MVPDDAVYLHLGASADPGAVADGRAGGDQRLPAPGQTGVHVEAVLDDRLQFHVAAVAAVGLAVRAPRVSTDRPTPDGLWRDPLSADDWGRSPVGAGQVMLPRISAPVEQGRTPRTRGIRTLLFRFLSRRRSIPAGAGATPWQMLFAACGSGVHPRFRSPAGAAKLPFLSDLWWRHGDCQPKLPADRSPERILVDFLESTAPLEQLPRGAGQGRPRIPWEARLPEVLTRYADAEAVYTGCHVYASVDPRNQADAGLRRFLHAMNGFPGYRVTVKERKPRGPYTCQHAGCRRAVLTCPHCGRALQGTVEKGVDTGLATDLIQRGARQPVRRRDP